MKEIKGDLIKLAQEGEFDIIGHGCNCFCLQGGGIAAQMSRVFNTLNPELYPSESHNERGNYSKLGNIETTSIITYVYEGQYRTDYDKEYKDSRLAVYNMYTQYKPGADLSYSALELCLQKLNQEASLLSKAYGRPIKVGLPWIGCGIAGGQKEIVEVMMNDIFKSERVELTVVEYDG